MANLVYNNLIENKWSIKINSKNELTAAACRPNAVAGL
jgi:hypothetical protein